jgi:ABC-type uncharacterized transport system permease subunit
MPVFDLLFGTKKHGQTHFSSTSGAGPGWISTAIPVFAFVEDLATLGLDFLLVVFYNLQR